MKLRKIVFTILSAVIILNIVAFIHAYKFTHFSTSYVERTKDPTELSAFEKIKILIFGIDNPKPKHKALPSHTFETVTVQSTTKLECWRIDVPNAKGTVILFHGFAGEKSAVLGRANEFLEMGYNTFLVDFMGSGGSEGNRTSIGFEEAEQVKACFDYLKSIENTPIILFGTSMGSAAILKAIHDYSLKPSAIILECPFGNLLQTVKARFKIMKAPSFPMAHLLTFWGGVQNGYWAFSHNPSTYALSVKCPTLLLFGAQDDRVSLQETQTIYDNLKGLKSLSVYPEEGHNVFTEKNQSLWKKDVTEFLKTL